MADPVEILLKVSDQATKPLHDAAKAAGEAKEAMDTTTKSAKVLSDALDDVKPSAGGAGDASDRARHSVSGLGDAADVTGRASTKLRGVLSLLPGGLGQVAGLANDAADAVEILASTFGMSLASIGPLAVAVAALGGAYYLLSKDLEEAEAKAKAMDERATKVAEATGKWTDKVKEIDAAWEKSTGRVSELSQAVDNARQSVLDASTAARQVLVDNLKHAESLGTVSTAAFAARDALASFDKRVAEEQDKAEEALVAENNKKQALKDAADAAKAAAAATQAKAKADAEAAKKAAEAAKAQAQWEATVKAGTAATAQLQTIIASGDPISKENDAYARLTKSIQDYGKAAMAAGMDVRAAWNLVSDALAVADAQHKQAIQDIADTQAKALLTPAEQAAAARGQVTAGATFGASLVSSGSFLSAASAASPVAGLAIGAAGAVGKIGTGTGPFAEVSGLLKDATKGLEAIPKVLPHFLTSMLEEVIPGLINAAPKLIKGLVADIPDFIAAIVAGVPDIIVTLVASVPDIIIALVTGLLDPTTWAKAVEHIGTSIADAFTNALGGTGEVTVKSGTGNDYGGSFSGRVSNSGGNSGGLSVKSETGTQRSYGGSATMRGQGGKLVLEIDADSFFDTVRGHTARGYSFGGA